MKVPRDYEVRPLTMWGTPDAYHAAELSGSLTTCGTCGRHWDDDIVTGITPAPSGRCPFEYYHGGAS